MTAKASALYVCESSSFPLVPWTHLLYSQVYVASKDHLSGGTDDIIVLPNPMDSDAKHLEWRVKEEDKKERRGEQGKKRLRMCGELQRDGA